MEAPTPTPTPKQFAKKTNKHKPSKYPKKTKPKRKVSEPFELRTKWGDPTFCILPRRQVSQRVYATLMHCPISVKDRDAFYERNIRNLHAWKRLTTKSFKFQAKKPIADFGYPTNAELRNAVERTAALRFQFKKLLHHWRFKHLKANNTEDIVTLDPPRKPIILVDWAGKRKTVYEASTLMRDITTCLLHHDGFWEEPKAPRDPLTNLPLTFSQILSVWSQLAHSGIPCSSAFAQFRQARYDLNRYHVLFAIPLRIVAYKKSMEHLEYRDAQEELLKFMLRAAFHNQFKVFKEQLKNFLRQHSTSSTLHKWTKLALESFENALLLHDNEDVRTSHQRRTYAKALPLLKAMPEFFVPPVPPPATPVIPAPARAAPLTITPDISDSDRLQQLMTVSALLLSNATPIQTVAVNLTIPDAEDEDEEEADDEATPPPLIPTAAAPPVQLPFLSPNFGSTVLNNLLTSHLQDMQQDMDEITLQILMNSILDQE